MPYTIEEKIKIDGITGENQESYIFNNKRENQKMYHDEDNTEMIYS